MERKKKMEKRNGKALLPIFVFVVLYLGLGILFEYGLRIEMGFYKIPVVVIFLIALLVACLQNRALQLNDKLAVMGTGISDPNIITMILIFMLAGIFVGVVGRSSANSVAYFILSLIPPQFAVAVLFIVSCLVSLLCRHNYADCPHRHCCCKGIRLFRASLHCFCHERCNVRG